MTIITADIEQVSLALRKGAVIAYPTEAMFGLGCAADNEYAATKILALKQRTKDKGLISLVNDLRQVVDWLDSSYQHLWPKAQQSWPAALTWLFPCSEAAPDWLTGGGSRIALRCPAHPLALQLCKQTPLISTSANQTMQIPAKTTSQVLHYFPDQLDLIVVGQCSNHIQSSQIRDLVTDKLLR